MSRKFRAVNRQIGEYWKPRNHGNVTEFLVMYDSGYLAIVSGDGWCTTVKPLNPRLWAVECRKD